MLSSLELLKQHIIKLEAENFDLRIKLSVSNVKIAELKCKNIEFLKANEKYNERCDAENAKLKAKIKKLKSKFRDRTIKVEQKQTLNDNSSNLSSSNFNLVTDQISMIMHHEKLLVDTSLPKDKKMNAFLDKVYKKKNSSKIRQKNQEKKL